MTGDNGEKEYKVGRKRKTSTGTKVLVAAAVIGGAGVIGYPLLQDANLFPPIETSQTDEFQDSEDGSNFGRIVPNDATPEPIIAPTFDAGPIEAELEAQRRALEAQNAQLAQDVAALQDRLSDMANAEPTDNSSAEIAAALQDMQTQNAALITQMQEEMDNRLAQAELETQTKLEAERVAREQAAADVAARQVDADERARQAGIQQQQLTDLITQLQRENQALSDQMNTGMSEALQQQAERDRLAALDRERRATLEARQAEAAALREAQIRSEAVVFDSGGQTSTPSEGANGATVPAGQQGPVSSDAAGRRFVLDGAPSVTVTASEVIANPSNTILQGTIIQASLETAIDSSLPGQIAAIVNRPVWSFDQSRILIPQGSRLFGSYDSDVSLGQQRILVGWTRLVTPDGQSVELASFGADDQGRSGVTGSVNNRFGLRFGSAALLSIIGTGPALAVAGQDNEIAAEAAERVAQNFAQTTNAVIGEYATLPPIISVQPGSSVSVIVDRDLEFY